MAKVYGIFFGFIGFFLILSFVAHLFQKSPEEIAREQCEEYLKASTSIGISMPITVYVNGTPYRCN